MRNLILHVLPCSGKKLDHTARVRDLYTGTTFRQALPVIEREAELATVLGPDTCVSAKHGLLELDEVIEPYDRRLDELDEQAMVVLEALLCKQLAELVGERDNVEISAFLPRAYLRVLSAGAALVGKHVTVTDVYEGCRGIDDMRHVIASVRATQAP
ncbi:DUF6884 domain-containing protein [Kutzneria sp. 744]|uniref:DUF6884 domain-containing protein n=1 Tax=Kutzneria sp. (strain 744) TaxID=345341 RepID=UPI0012F77DB8|nr:DUF6884 domain-containing protein [Kutzneria sp. 744]